MIPHTVSLQVSAVVAPTAGSQRTTQRARHVSRLVCVCVHACMYTCLYMCVSVCAICYVTQLVKCQFFLLSVSVSKIVCPAHCPKRCSELDGSQFCCNAKCAAGCIGGVTESHCVVSVNGGGRDGWKWRWEGEVMGGNGGGRVKGGRSEGWKWRWEGEGWGGSFLVYSKVMLSTCCCTGLPLAVATCDHLISLLGLREVQQRRNLCGHMSAEIHL